MLKSYFPLRPELSEEQFLRQQSDRVSSEEELQSPPLAAEALRLRLQEPCGQSMKTLFLRLSLINGGLNIAHVLFFVSFLCFGSARYSVCVINLLQIRPRLGKYPPYAL